MWSRFTTHCDFSYTYLMCFEFVYWIKYFIIQIQLVMFLVKGGGKSLLYTTASIIDVCIMTACMCVCVAHMSIQPCSPMISMAFMCSPAVRYMSAAARGSLLFFAQSACFFISSLVSLGSAEPRKSFTHAKTHCECFLSSAWLFNVSAQQLKHLI